MSSINSNKNIKDADYFPIVIIGAGLAGSTAFFEISKFENVLLIEKRKNIMDYPYEMSRVVVAHSFQFIPKEVDMNDISIFPRQTNVVQYSSNKEIVNLMSQHDLGTSIGKMIDECAYCKKVIMMGENNGGIVKWGCNVENICRNYKNDNITQDNKHIAKFTIYYYIDGENRCLYSDLVIMATGSDSLDLQRDLGFETPNTYISASALFHIDQKYADIDIPMDYMFHRHPKISWVGPLAMTRTNTFFNLHILSDQNPDEIKRTFLRVIQNYSHIADFFAHTKEKPSDMDVNDIKIGKCGNRTISKFHDDGIAIIGEAAGLVMGFYFEGVPGSLASAQIIATCLKNHLNNNLLLTMSQDFLKKYEDSVRKRILRNWEKSQNASEDLFVGGGKYQFDIWDSYIKVLRKNPKVRKNVYDAWIEPDLGNYKLENDEYCGEKIYLNLPLAKKVMLAPHFLRLKFTK